MATSPLFGWQEPDDTSLVKDGAAAIRTLGNAIDTSMGDLLGGTTGQVLAKASNTNMDFTWVAQDDSNAIQNAIVDAKGDLIAATANDTPARLAAGSNGETLVADSSTSTGLRYQGNYAAGKNKIINGDFGIWQRGTSISLSNGVAAYTADRFRVYTQFSAGTSSLSQQTFTAGTAPVAGYEGTYFARLTCGSTASYIDFSQKIEDVRNFAGQTATFSFWAKSSASIVLIPYLIQEFGTGGSGNVNTAGSSITLTTSWTRYSVTLSVPSVSGKTIGAGNALSALLAHSSGTLNNATVDFWGWQVEAGSVATAFQTATGTIQGETSACQRYYYRVSDASSTYWRYGQGNGENTSVAQIQFQCPTTMRVRPTAMEYSNFGLVDGSAAYTGGTWAINTNRSTSTSVTADYTHGSAALTQKQSYGGISAGTASSYIAFTAEL